MLRDSGMDYDDLALTRNQGNLENTAACDFEKRARKSGFLEKKPAQGELDVVSRGQGKRIRTKSTLSKARNIPGVDEIRFKRRADRGFENGMPVSKSPAESCHLVWRGPLYRYDGLPTVLFHV